MADDNQKETPTTQYQAASNNYPAPPDYHEDEQNALATKIAEEKGKSGYVEIKAQEAQEAQDQPTPGYSD